MPTSDGPRAVLRPALDVIVEEIHDELCLLRLDTSDVLILNRTAADVWLLLTEETDLDSLVAVLATAYEVSPESIADDVSTVVDEMQQRGFVELVARG